MATAKHTEQFEVRNRWTNAVQFTAEITCAPDASISIKLGLAVKWALKARAHLADANLTGANLAGANLAGTNLADAYLARANLAGAHLADANLAGANLAGANLADAYLARANLAGTNLADAHLARAYLAGANLADAKNLTNEALRPIIADYWMILSMARPEVPALISALRNGRVDGSTYVGECACLVGSLENAGASGLPHVASSPAERWFASIRKGDRPGEGSAGGFATLKALEWAERYCAVTGIELEAA